MKYPHSSNVGLQHGESRESRVVVVKKGGAEHDDVSWAAVI